PLDLISGVGCGSLLHRSLHDGLYRRAFHAALLHPAQT
ncbi:transposase domain protein, partial [Yersinia pestis PY-91]